MEFQKDPARATADDRIRVKEVLRGSKVTNSGWFDRTGVFDVKRRGEAR